MGVPFAWLESPRLAAFPGDAPSPPGTPSVISGTTKSLLKGHQEQFLNQSQASPHSPQPYPPYAQLQGPCPGPSPGHHQRRASRAPPSDDG